MTLCDHKGAMCLFPSRCIFLHSFSGNVQVDVHTLIRTNYEDVCHRELLFFSSPTKHGVNSPQEFYRGSFEQTFRIWKLNFTWMWTESHILKTLNPMSIFPHPSSQLWYTCIFIFFIKQSSRMLGVVGGTNAPNIEQICFEIPLVLDFIAF